MRSCLTPSWDKIVDDGAMVNAVCSQAVVQGQSDLVGEFTWNIEVEYLCSITNSLGKHTLACYPHNE